MRQQPAYFLGPSLGDDGIILPADHQRSGRDERQLVFNTIIQRNLDSLYDALQPGAPHNLSA